jgi:3-oxoacyl-[acyl-carrier protein] reductase
VDLGIRGRKAIVNGGSAGMGRGSVLALAREGVELFVSARGEERLVRACEEIVKETGAKITPVMADHSTDAGRAKILAACPDPDILVGTCAPPPVTGDYRSITRADWQSTLDISLLSPVQFMQATIDGMVERKWGRIVNIGSYDVVETHVRQDNPAMVNTNLEYGFKIVGRFLKSDQTNLIMQASL